jgi:mRNA-degrading endonuclease toxin of MazEF toxin-antitoxin module
VLDVGEIQVPSLSSKDISRLEAVKALAVSPGDVFLIPKSRARYFRSPSGRPGVVVRVLRSVSNEASLAYLVYGTTKSVQSSRALPVEAGEADLDRDTTFDFGPWLELPVSDLIAECRPLGRLEGERMNELETALAASRLPFRGLAQ